MSSLLKMALVLSLVDRMSAPTNKANNTLGNMGKTAGLVSGKFGKLVKDVDLFVGRMEKVSRAGRNVALGGMAAGGMLGLGSVPAEAARAEHSLRAMGNVSELTNNQLAGVSSSLLDMTDKTNQSMSELIVGMKTLTSAGLDPRIATRFMPAIGKAATATQSEVEDLSKTVYAVHKNLGISEDKIVKSIDSMALAGNRGSFELKNMARHFPTLTAGAKSLHMQGVPAVASLSAALQIAMKGAGSEDEAANNFKNFLQKITSKDTVKNFKKLGVDVEKEMNKATAKGLDPIEHMLNVITKLTGGNKFKLADLFADMQVTDFLLPMMQNMGEYRKIRDEAMNASGVVDKAYIEMMGTTIEQWKALKITMAKVVMPNLAGPLSLVNGLLKVMTGNALLTKMTFYGIAATVTGGGLLFGLGTIATMLPKVAGGWAMLKTAVMMTNPLLWAATAIAGAGYMVWKNWGTLKQPGFLKDLRGWIRNETLLGQFYQGGVNIVSSLLKGMKSVAMKPVELIKGIAQKIRNHLPFSPAKEGPLRDIHRIRLVETIAGSLKPAPLVKAMRAVTAATFVSLLPVSATSLQAHAANFSTQATSIPAMATTVRHPTSAPIVVNYSPVINISGDASPGTESKFAELLRKHEREIERIMLNINRQQERRAFS